MPMKSVREYLDELYDIGMDGEMGGKRADKIFDILTGLGYDPSDIMNAVEHGVDLEKKKGGPIMVKKNNSYKQSNNIIKRKNGGVIGGGAALKGFGATRKK